MCIVTTLSTLYAAHIHWNRIESLLANVLITLILVVYSLVYIPSMSITIIIFILRNKKSLLSSHFYSDCNFIVFDWLAWKICGYLLTIQVVDNIIVSAIFIIIIIMIPFILNIIFVGINFSIIISRQRIQSVGLFSKWKNHSNLIYCLITKYFGINICFNFFSLRFSYKKCA